MRMPVLPLSLTTLLVLAIDCSAAEAAAGAPDRGAIAGTVRFTGKVPEPREILTTEGGTIRHNDLVVDPKSKGLRFVVASLEGAPKRPKAEKAEPAVMDQRDMVFLPRVLAVQHGRPVRFDNSDACNHSVLTSSRLPANQFNVFVTGDRPYTHAFEAQERPVVLGCSLHAWMRAYVFVLSHPWFDVTDKEGRLRIKDVPPGKYTLLLRHPDTGHLERRPVEVKAGKTAEVTVEWAKAGDQGG